MTYAIETRNLRHRFSTDDYILKGLDIKVPQGSIYGFIGKNGAGKTTTLKLILGLLKQQEGEVLIDGLRLQEHRVSVLKEIGSLIESPSFYGHLSAVDNLRVLQMIYQCSDDRVMETLNLVGLSDTGKKKVSAFSLGMKQRLSIAIAMLHQPKLLILDEPTNGLDPNGIIEIRELLKHINATLGTTIVISSHLLAEIERLVSHLAVINQGELVFQGDFETLKLNRRQGSSIIICINKPDLAFELISKRGIEASLNTDAFRFTNIPRLELADVVR